MCSSDLAVLSRLMIDDRADALSTQTTRAAACLTWEALSFDVRWRPLLSVVIVTRLGNSPSGIYQRWSCGKPRRS